MTEFLVLWQNGSRIGSLPLTDQNKDGINAMYCANLIQRDITGTEHWNILCPLGKRESKSLQASYGKKYGDKALLELLNNRGH